MKTMHLFAGGGGGLLADLILGHEPIAAVEWDAAACHVLRERRDDGWFPNLSVYEGDVRVFNPSDYAGRVDCIHAGFPCQDISVAGKQAGLEEGTRSGLYREVLRIAGIVRPRYLFLENVAAILNTGLGTVLADLATLGYDTRWCCIRASDVGAPHGRDRWWLRAEWRGLSPHAQHDGHGRREQFTAGAEKADGMGNPKHNGQPAQPQLRSHETPSDDGRTQEQDATRQLVGANRPADVPSLRRSEGGSQSDLADTNSFNGVNRQGRPSEECSGQDSQRIRTISIRECGNEPELADTMCVGLEGRRQDRNTTRPAGLRCGARRDEKQDLCHSRTDAGSAQPPMGGMADGLAAELVQHQDWFSTEPEIGRTAPKRSDHAANLKMLGNGQVPLQAALAWKLLEKAA